VRKESGEEGGVDEEAELGEDRGEREVGGRQRQRRSSSGGGGEGDRGWWPEYTSGQAPTIAWACPFALPVG